MALVLASESPRRRELMQLITADFEVDQAGIDESSVRAGNPRDFAQVAAQQKAWAVFSKRQQDVVVGCDTVVELNQKLLGKPRDAVEAAEMIRCLSGQRHWVHTGICFLMPQGNCVAFTETTAVYFCEISEQQILDYAASEEPLDKAGAYGIQGWAARYIPRIEGCYYNVMGLPVSALHQAFLRNGIL